MLNQQKILSSFYYQDLHNLITFISNNSNNKLIYGEKTDINIGKINRQEYIVLQNTPGQLNDIQSSLLSIRKKIRDRSKLLVIYYNYLWEPILKFLEIINLKKKKKQKQNWLTIHDTENLLFLSGFSTVSKGKRLLLPLYIPFLSSLINKFIAPLPIINNLCLTCYLLSEPAFIPSRKEYSVSIIIPVRNEEGNIKELFKRVSKIGKWTEIIFVEGHSKDNSWQFIKENIKKYKKLPVRAYKQKGVGKADAVHLGVSLARGEVIIILDADLTVAPEDLFKFYDALANGYGKLINGTRMVYPLEKDSMRFLNKIGNKLFGKLFTWILNQRFTDTLCGTKAFFRKDYFKILKLRKIFGDFDPFGDFEILFGASKLNLKIIEIPVRYHPRQYGSTNISRFSHSLLLFKMCLFAFRKFKMGESR